MAKNKILTIEDLINYFQVANVYSFSSKEAGQPIVVQAIQDFSAAEIEKSEDGKCHALVRVCHTLKNRNNSFVSEESMTKAMPTLKYSPLLAAIHQLDDGTWDFHGHDMHIETDAEGNEFLVYDEHQIGTFTEDDPYLEYDESMDKTYVMARVVIPEDYTRAADIIREKKGTKVSCELTVYDCSYNVKEKYLQLNDFRFNGCTCLGSEKDGTPIEEGMLGSKLTLEDFSEENNSLIKFSQQLIDIQTKIDAIETRLNYTESKEGGTNDMEKFEELLEKYGKTVEDIEFDYSEMDNEALEAAFKEAFETIELEVDPEVDPEPEEVEVEEPEVIVTEDLHKDFAVSHEDIRYALYNLLAPYEEADNEWYWIVSVYDDHFVYQGYSGNYFGQKYSVENDEVSFVDERYELFAEFVTRSEKAELDAMRANYSSIQAELNTYKTAELNAQKEEILSNEAYEELADNVAFVELKKNMENYSLEELASKAKEIFADHVMTQGHFAYKSVSVNRHLSINNKPEVVEEKPYGGLVED